MLLQVSAPHFCAGIEFRDDVAVRTAPILAWAKGKSRDELMCYFQRKGWKAENYMTHLMLDIESLSTRTGAVILSVALVRFSDEAHCTVNLSLPDQEALGLERDAATCEWWAGQEAAHPGAWAAATSNPQPLVAALTYLADWIRWASPEADPLIWCHGATFDAPLLGEVYRRAGLACPWKFWNIQCTRTLYNLAGISNKAYAVPPPHIALNDAIGQTRAANAALAKLAKVHANAA